MFPTKIKTEDEFLSLCAPGPQLLSRARAEETDSVKWFFSECWADFQEGRYSAIFTSYRTPEYEGCLLSLEATRRAQGGWVIRRVTRRLKAGG